MSKFEHIFIIESTHENDRLDSGILPTGPSTIGGARVINAFCNWILDISEHWA